MTNFRKLNELIKKGQPFSSAEARKTGAPSQSLTRLCRNGTIQRVARGVYINPQSVSEYDEIKTVSKVIPYGVICLISALKYHNLTSQLPHQTWLAIPQGRRRKIISYPEVTYISLSPPCYNFGIEEHTHDGVTFKVYSIAKTIADCFKFRNKIGLDVALEVLREAKVDRKATNTQIIEAAKVCRVAKIIMPYLEVLS